MSFNFIESDYTGFTAGDGDVLPEISISGMFVGQTATRRFILGNTSEVRCNFTVSGQSVNTELLPYVYFSVDNGLTYEQEVTLAGIEPNNITQSIILRFNPPEGSKLGVGTFLIDVNQELEPEIERVQFDTAPSGGITNTWDFTFPTAPTDGNFLVMVIGHIVTANVVSITQTGCTWKKAVNGTGDVAVEIWYAENVKSAGTTATILMGGLVLGAAVGAEYKDIALSDSLDKTASASASNTSSSNSGTTDTTSQDNELWISGHASAQPFIVANQGFTLIDQDSQTVYAGLFENIVNEQGQANTIVTLAANSNVVGAMACFKRRELSG